MNELDPENIFKDWDKQHIEFLLDQERFCIEMRDLIDSKNVFSNKRYDQTWQFSLDVVRKELKEAKNDFRNRFNEEFISG